MLTLRQSPSACARPSPSGRDRRSMGEALRYYFDEHVHAAISSGLQARGIDVLTAQAAGRANKRIPDDEQLAYATARGLVIVTNDRDFIRLHREQIPHAGIIMLQQI